MMLSMLVYIAVSIAETLLDGGHQGFKKLRLLELAEESQSTSSNKLVGVLQSLQE